VTAWRSGTETGSASMDAMVSSFMVISQNCLSGGATLRTSQSASGTSCGGPENVRHTLNTQNLDSSRAAASPGERLRWSMVTAAAALKSACAKSPVNVVPAGRGTARSLTRITGLLSSAVAAQPVSVRTRSRASATYRPATSSRS